MNFSLCKNSFLILLLTFSNFSLAATHQTMVVTKELQTAMTPDQVLQLLKDGNARFKKGEMKNRDIVLQVKKTSEAQAPLAVVLGCLDSRVAPEIIFDLGVGKLFVARIAGNIQNPDILGSMEFATHISGAKLIVVLGHTRCGAIKGACQDAKLGNLTGLLDKIQPAISEVAKQGKKDCDNYDFIDSAARMNVKLVIKQILQNSPVIKRLVDDGQVKIVGGMQDLATGEVSFFE